MFTDTKAISVIKFGGTSMQSTVTRQAVISVIKSHIKSGKKVIAVVSAEAGETDRLYSFAKAQYITTQAEIALIVATGEMKSASILSAGLMNQHVTASALQVWQIPFMVHEDKHKPLAFSINKDFIYQQFESVDVCVIPGFQGVNAKGEITLLSRGGSDLTAVALADLLALAKCTLYKDVDGVFNKHPEKKGALLINTLSYDQMLQLARCGAGIVQEKAIQYAKDNRIEIGIANTFTGVTGSLISTHQSAFLSSGISLVY